MHTWETAFGAIARAIEYRITLVETSDRAVHVMAPFDNTQPGHYGKVVWACRLTVEDLVRGIRPHGPRMGGSTTGSVGHAGNPHGIVTVSAFG